MESIENRLDETESRTWAPVDRRFGFIRSQIVIFPTQRHITELQHTGPHIG